MEVIIALAIISIIAAMFSSISFTGLKISVNNKKNLQSVVIAENYLEEIRLARENNPNNIKSRDSLAAWLNNSKSWLSANENLVHFQNDPSDNQVIVRYPDASKGVLYTTTVRCSLVASETDLYEFTIQVSQPNANSYVLSTRLFAK